MFYNKFLELCRVRYIAPTQAAAEAGLHRGTPSAWKRSGRMPGVGSCCKLAKYFGVTVNEILALGEEGE